MGQSNEQVKEEILLAVSISLGALFFATVITLIIARFYKQIRGYCQSCCPSDEADNNNTSTSFFGTKSPGDSKPVIPYTKLAERRKEALETKKSVKKRSPIFLPTVDNQFIIPGLFYSNQIQPELKMPMRTETNGGRNSSLSSHPGPPVSRRHTASVASLPANFSPSLAGRIINSQAEQNFLSSEEDNESGELQLTKPSISLEDIASFDMRPEMYNIARQRTLGVGQLGKLHVSMQYEDKSRKKMNIIINELTKLQAMRPDVVSIYASVVLLPERESIYTTKQHKAAANATVAEKFVFSSKPMNRDFESKTALFLVHHVDRAGKDVVYGESRMPLLCREIYSQVSTDVTLNIKCASMQSEFGDLLVQMIYLDSGTLDVMIKMIKVPQSMSLENMSGLNFKCYARKFGNRTGKKTTIAKRLEGSPEYSSDINRECKFRIPREDFMDHDITCSVGGKHKILGKKLHLGKVVIGNGSKDETGVVHWKTIFASPGIAWAVWHPIYSS